MMASSEAERAFGNGAVYVEKYIENARHVEIQIMADHHGNVVHLGERDCSIQRRHQKLMEETPCPVLSSDQRRRMGKLAVRAAEAISYRGAGTIEFLLDSTGHFYFMEMNTRIQVEHPVTEMATGYDLVKEQIKIAAGQRLSFEQKEINPQGYVIEFRINAEDPANNFAPSPGRVEWVHFPGGPGIRVDSHVYSGYDVLPFYDSLIAKLIVRGDTREEAIQRMSGALSEFMIEGIKTTAPLGRAILNDASFRRGRYHTAYLEQLLKDGLGGMALAGT
jgi:acetyl-CoA carboxylase biotin carboxylase subunit